MRCPASRGPLRKCGKITASISKPSKTGSSISRSCWEWRKDSSQYEGGPPNRGATNGGAISFGFQVHATTSSIDKPRFVCSPLQTGLPLRTPSAADQILLTPDISASTKCSRLSFADQACGVGLWLACSGERLATNSTSRARSSDTCLIKDEVFSMIWVSINYDDFGHIILRELMP